MAQHYPKTTIGVIFSVCFCLYLLVLVCLFISIAHFLSLFLSQSAFIVRLLLFFCLSFCWFCVFLLNYTSNIGDFYEVNLEFICLRLAELIKEHVLVLGPVLLNHDEFKST